MAELVAWKTEHREVLVLVRAPQCFKAFVLRGKTALAGNVDDQQHLAGIGVKLLLLAINGFGVEVVYRRHGVLPGCYPQRSSLRGQSDGEPPSIRLLREDRKSTRLNSSH